ncbi:MAG: hypothetical protein ACRDL4_15225 [Thermoleophilaceae bacterium]
MTQRTQITLPSEDHRRARARAAELGISLAEYVRRLVARDLHNERGAAPVEALFALGSSGESDDVAARKDEYVGEAVDRDAGR